MPEEDRKDFFISYTNEDRAWAEWIAWQLDEAGYTTILQAWDFRPGLNFVLQMQQAAMKARHTITVLSPDYLSSQYYKEEWTSAFTQDPTGDKGLLVPVRVRECEPNKLLGPIVYIDLVGLGDEAARETLIAGAQQRRAKPSSRPRFPGAAAQMRLKGEAPRLPGALPPIWKVPHPRNPNFTGRDKLLKDLRNSLTAGQAKAQTQVALHGLGGVGKTQLALEYAYRFAQDYDLVWWVRSEDSVTLASEYATLAGPLNLAEKEAVVQEIAVAAVRQALGQRQNWLLVFDNAAEPQDLKEYLPQGGGGHVLITSRNPVWRGVAKPLDVRVWDRKESVAFLLKRTGQQNDRAAAELARELGDLPLALEQAGAHIEQCGDTIGHYLGLFRSRSKDFLSRGQPPQDYPETLVSLWEVFFHQIKEESLAATEFLNLCAFLAPDDIPKELLEQGATHLPPSLAAAVQDPMAFNDALAVLRLYSLIEVGDEGLAVHRLVQAVARDRLSEEEQKQWAGAAVEMVNAAFPRDMDVKVETWPWCARLLPHALAAAGQAESRDMNFPALGQLLVLTGFYLQLRAEFAGAKNCFERAMAIDEAFYGPDHPAVATDMNNLGSVLQDLGDLSGARVCFERAVHITEAAYEPDHPELATAINNLGSALQDLGDLSGARACFERAWHIAEAAYGSDHPEVAKAMNNLGRVLRTLGDLEGAKAHFERALSITEASYGPNHPEVATATNNLGRVLRAMGDLEGARAHYERALRIDEAAYGADHPQVAIRVNNLGGVLRAQGELEGAKADYERALAIWEKFLGPNHPHVATAVNNLGRVLHDLRDLPGARAHCERALAIDEAAYGPDHPAMARDVNNLGLVLRDLGDLAGARACFERALAIYEAIYGPDHLKPNEIRRNLSNLQKLMGGLK